MSARSDLRRAPGETALWGLMVDFETVEQLITAAEKIRDAGYTRWDAHTPFPVHGLDRAMGLKGSRLPWIVMAGGTVGCGFGIFLQWWTNAHNYQFAISGKPFWSLPANIPIAFELTVLFSAITAFTSVILLNGLPQLHHPVFTSERFRRVTQDRFFLSIEASDPLFDEQRTLSFLRGLGGTAVERLEV